MFYLLRIFWALYVLLAEHFFFFGSLAVQFQQCDNVRVCAAKYLRYQKNTKQRTFFYAAHVNIFLYTYTQTLEQQSISLLLLYATHFYLCQLQSILLAEKD